MPGENSDLKITILDLFNWRKADNLWTENTSCNIIYPFQILVDVVLDILHIQLIYTNFI